MKSKSIVDCVLSQSDEGECPYINIVIYVCVMNG